MQTSLQIMKHTLCLVVIILGIPHTMMAQNRQLVWADEFNGSSIDPSIWQFESGQSNDNVQFYTNRQDNAKITDGVLQIIALKESYQGFDFTSAHIRTEKAQYWRYGRMEASIKVPGTNGFVPAFWMLPVDNKYGWWPLSGEIDIMEHPSNEITKIYGTVHTGKYNLFDGPLLPQGDVVDVPDAESAFHLYAVEWTPEKIDFYVDDQKYYTFMNDNGATDTWPFDQPVYIILNLALGGGWVGTPDESSVFPAIMEVDYVRVYQDLNEVEIQGADFVTYNTESVTYHLGDIEGADILWSLPGGARIVSGQGTPQIAVDWGIFGGEVKAEMDTGEGTILKSHSVRVSPNYIKNMGFEKGVKYWQSAAGFPSKANFTINTDVVHSGDNSIFAEVTDTGSNPWDVQLSQRDLMLQGGTEYQAGLQVKSEATQDQISAVVINASTFAPAGQKSFTPGQEWGSYEFTFTAPSNMSAAFNIDMGSHTGNYHFDDISLTTSELTDLNLVKNPDFFDGELSWDLVNLSTGVSTGTIVDGEYAVLISNGCENAWDIHLGQSGLPVENGFEYLLSFDAYASAPSQITALVGKNGDPWNIYSNAEPISLTSTKQTYTFNFSMKEPTDLQSRLGFDIGGDVTQLYFDNILLRKGEAVNTTSNKAGNNAEPAHALQNYPNPVHKETTFFYVLNEPVQVTLGIFNLHGQKVGTVVNGFQQEGEHQVSWSASGLASGIYFYRLDAGEKSETRKLILIQ